MRALRVVGLHEDGKSIVCEDTERGEKFLLPADERLRAAARGDITRLGQIQIELESQMRPREIQARIRAGETVAQLAANAGIPEQRVERFAYPVLLERARTAELAQDAHPVREDGPDVRTLGEVVAYAFGVRGQDYTTASWDAWRGEGGKWVVCLRWQTGRSDNRAHWSFSPGAHGGTVAALDDNAADLHDPEVRRSPRTLRPVIEEDDEQAMLDPDWEEEPEDATVIEAPLPTRAEAEAAPEAPDDVPPAPRRKAKKGHPVVPAWEDVLLGVRSQRG
ncbi:septation protein SepH [Haloechinothrix halophila]|uniref:septation protein SepH n=1 Tax=Haloechinothrix halophila TaxID=1069073 RepID=UPI000420B8B8|nr:septation protein SepH [Haloechinothrix halophila]